MEYYDWDTTRSKNADVTIVIAARGYGKTFGMRKFFVSDYLKKGIRFCEITRVNDSIPDIARNYFEKLQAEGYFLDYAFKYQRKSLMIAKKTEDGKNMKWETCGYFASINTFQADKQRTFVDCRNIGMDEYIIEPDDNFHDYSNNEWYKLTSLVSSIGRERPVKGLLKKIKQKTLPKPHVYLLGNAGDLNNPAFAHYGVNNVPQTGYTWLGNKTCILHYVEDAEYADASTSETVAGRMAGETQGSAMMASNVFMNSNNDFIASKPKTARYSFGFVHRGNTYGVWADIENGLYYINTKVPNNAPGTLYAVSTKDATYNRAFAKSAKKPLQMLTEMYGYGLVRFDTHATRSEFNRMCAFFGMR